MASMSLLIAGSVTQYARLKYNVDKGRKKFRELAKPDTCKYLKKSEESGATDAAFESLKTDPVKQKTAALAAKLKSGKRLSQAEIDWLEENAPELAEKAKAVRDARDEYKQKLKECRTKLDVAMAKADAMSAIQKQIPSAADADKAETLLMHIAAVHDEHSAFTASAEYKNLPDKDPEAVDAADERRRAGRKKNGI